MVFFFLSMGVDQLSTQMKMEMALFLAIPLVLGLHSDIIYFGALRLGGHNPDKSMDPLPVDHS